MNMRIVAFSYLKKFWKKIASLILLSFLATFFLTLKPIVVAGIIDITFEKVGHPSQSVTQVLPQEKEGSFFNLNELGAKVKGAIVGKDDNVLDSSSSLWVFLFILLGLALLASAAKYSADVLNSYIRNKVMCLIRRDLFDSILKMDMTFFHQHRSGDLISRVVTDTMAFAQGIVSISHRIFHSSIEILVYGIYLVNTSLYLTVSIVFVFIGHYGISILIKNLVRKREEVIYDSSANLSAALQESFTNIRVVKSFGNDRYESNRIKCIIDKSSDAYFKAQAVGYIEPEARFSLDVVAEVMILFIAINQLLNGELNIQGFLLYIYVARLVMAPINQFGVYYVWIQRILASFKRIGGYLGQSAVVVDGCVKKVSFNSKINFSNVSFNYADKPVIHDLSVTIKKGEIIAIVGPSGAGKSTLTDLVLRFYDPKKGKIMIDGIDLKDIKSNDYRKMFGVVPQESLLFNDTIANNIQFGREPFDQSKLELAAKIANAHDFIMELSNGYQTMVGDRGIKLSGGQRQRISIARAIYSSPEIVIFDEATSSLDSESEEQVHKAIDNVLSHSTAVIIAHRLSTILHADKILVLNNGKLEAIGKHKDLLETNETYRTLYHLQFSQDES